MTSIPLADARNRLSHVLDEVGRTHERVTITRHGQPVAVVLAVEDLASLEETMALLATPGALAQVRTGVAELDAGETVDWTELAAARTGSTAR